MVVTYFEFVDLIEKLKYAPIDENLLKDLENKKIDGTRYSLHKLATHIFNIASTRVNNTFQKFIDKMLTGKVSDVDVLALELVNLKKEFNFSKRIVNNSIISDDNKNKCRESLNNFIKKICDILEDVMKRADSSGGYISIYNKIMVSDMEE